MLQVLTLELRKSVEVKEGDPDQRSEVYKAQSEIQKLVEGLGWEVVIPLTVVSFPYDPCDCDGMNDGG
jgi:hypothetical protein